MAQPIPFPTQEPQEGLSLPQNVEAEAALLGAMMIDNRVAEDVLQKLRPEHFFEPLHGRIYGQAMALIERNSIATPVTLKPFFENDEAMKAVGYESLLVTAYTGVAAAPFGGPTLLSLCNMGLASKCARTLPRFSAVERQRLLETTPETRRCAADDRRKAAQSGRVSGVGAARWARGRRRGAAATVSSTDRVPEVSLD